MVTVLTEAERGERRPTTCNGRNRQAQQHHRPPSQQQVTHAVQPLFTHAPAMLPGLTVCLTVSGWERLQHFNACFILDKAAGLQGIRQENAAR
jgi:hypothetical protein